MKTHEEQIEELEETIIYYKEVQEKRQLAPYAIRYYLNVCKQKAKELKAEIEKGCKSETDVLGLNYKPICGKNWICFKCENQIKELNKIIGEIEF